MMRNWRKKNSGYIERVIGVLLMAYLCQPLAAHAVDDTARVDQGQSVTRHYATLADGLQIHYRQADPVQGSSPPVFALHQSPVSGQIFVEFMANLGLDRRVIAPDTPGFGQSDLPAQQPSVEDYAKRMDQLADALGITSLDVVGYHTGAAIAVAWAELRPERVRRLMLVGLPAMNGEERERIRSAPWPAPTALDEARVASEWRGSKQWQGPGQSDRSLERTYLAKLSAGPTAWWGAAAVAEYPFLERLTELEQPALLVRPKDDLWTAGGRVRAALPGHVMVDLPDHGFGVFEAIPGHMADLARQAFPAPEQP